MRHLHVAHLRRLGLGAALLDPGHVRLGRPRPSGWPQQAPWWEPGTASGYHAQQPGAPGRRGRSGGSPTPRSRSSSPTGSPARWARTSRSARAESDGPASRRVVAPPPPEADRGDAGPGVDGREDLHRPARLGRRGQHARVAGGRPRCAQRALQRPRGAARAARAQRWAARPAACGCCSPATVELMFDQQSDGVDLVLGVPFRFGIGLLPRLAGSCPTCPTGAPSSGAAGVARWP